MAPPMRRLMLAVVALPLALLFAPEHLRSTLTIWGSFILNSLTLYGFVNWLPLVLRSTGMPLSAALAKIDTRSGADLSGQATCGDTDDLFLIGDRTLVICGAGHIDLVRGASTVARIETGGGARTGLYVPELRSLFVALPSRGKPAAIWRLELH